MAPGSASFPSGSHHLDPVELISNHVLRTEVDLMFDYVSEKNLVNLRIPLPCILKLMHTQAQSMPRPVVEAWFCFVVGAY